VTKLAASFAVGQFVLLLVLATGCSGGAEGRAAATAEASAKTRDETVSGAESRSSRLLFLAGDGELTVVDVEARSAEVLELPQLRPGDPPFRIVRRGSKLVLYGGDTYTLDSDLRSPPEKLGKSWFFIPSSKPDRVWLAILDPESPETVRALAGVREVTVEGRVTVPEVTPPGGRWPVGAVADALVFESRSGGLEVWDPLTGDVKRRLPGASMGTTHADLLAWCDATYETLHITNVVTGGARAVAPPEGFVAFDCWSGVFSPDGTLLAVPVTTGRGPEAERTLALVDVERGVARTVAGSGVEPPYVYIAWASSGESVFVSGGERYDRRILEYRLGDGGAVSLPVEVGDFYGMAAG
jgi:hypothetical protein